MNSLNYNIFVLSFGALQGLILSFFLIKHRRAQSANYLLLIYLLAMLLQVAMKIANKAWLMNNVTQLYLFSYILPFLYGPLLYLMVRTALFEQYKVKFGDLKHFAPFLGLLFLRCWIEWSPNYTLSLTLVRLEYLAPLSILAYHLMAFRLLKTVELAAQFDESNLLEVRNTQREWLKKFSWASFICTLLLSLVLLVMHAYYPILSDIRWLFAVATLFIYWVSYQVLVHPEYFQSKPQAVRSAPSSPKYHNSSLNQTELRRILCELEVIMEEKRPYLDPELGIDELALMVQTNRHNLSQALNGHLQKNFFDYLNGYRVKAAQEMLNNPEHEHLKIASIAYDAGFNSISTFNAVFKKATGQKPSDYRKSYQL
jgi:AraC-like DNA-binding protein